MDDDALPLTLTFVHRDPYVPNDIDVFFATGTANTGRCLLIDSEDGLKLSCFILSSQISFDFKY